MFRRKNTNLLTYLASGCELQGNLKVEGSLRVDGVVLGTVEIGGDLEVSPTGRIEGAELRAKNILIHGSIKARVVAEGKLTMSRRARIEGDVVAHALDIENGAFYVGHIAIRELSALPGSKEKPQLLSGEDD